VREGRLIAPKWYTYGDQLACSLGAAPEDGTGAIGIDEAILIS